VSLGLSRRQFEALQILPVRQNLQRRRMSP
jgi:hypothetical protein